MIYQPVLSDVDDTLISTKEIQRSAWTEWATGHGLNPADFLADGVRIQEKLALHAPHLSPETELARLAEITANCPIPARALPGALDLLSAVAPLGLVTSGPRRITVPMLESAGLPVPPVVVTADDVSRGKPDPEPYLKGAELLGVPPCHCVVLEDAVAGVKAARAAGMTVVAVTTTTTKEELRAAGARLVLPHVGAFLRRRELAPISPTTSV